MTTTVTLFVGDVRDVLATLPDNYAHLLITSPPFLALRSYLPADHPDKHREIGSEPTPAAFLDTLYGLTKDWGRIIPEWGSICVELGDTMSGSGGAGGDHNADGLREGQPRFRQKKADGDEGGPRYAPGGGPINRGGGMVPFNGGPGWPLAKSMCVLPHAYTLGLAYGHNPLTGQPSPAGQWRIRNVICWARPNPPVGSLGKRNPQRRTGDYKFRPATSYITVACRGTGRYFDLDAVRHPHDNRYLQRRFTPMSEARGVDGVRTGKTMRGVISEDGGMAPQGNPAGAPPLDWHADDLDGDWLWKLATAPYPGSHYATYPLTLPRRLLLAMCPERVCEVCGWPSERVTKAVRTVDGVPINEWRKDRPPPVKRSGWSELSVRSERGANGQDSDLHINSNRVGTDRTTLGWTDCGCADDVLTNTGISVNTWRPGRVLDPFGGSGTTAVAAALEHRDAVLIDLDHRNVDLVRRRLADHLIIHDEQRDGDTITWTVEPASRQTLEAVASGQLGFDLWENANGY